MKKILLTLGIIASFIFLGTGVAYARTLFYADQLGSSPVAGYVLQSNTTGGNGFATWVSTSSLGIIAGGPFSTTSINGVKTVSFTFATSSNNNSDVQIRIATSSNTLTFTGVAGPSLLKSISTQSGSASYDGSANTILFSGENGLASRATNSDIFYVGPASGYTIPRTASTTQYDQAYASTTALTPLYIRGLFSNTATGLTYNSTTGLTSLTAGFVIPTTATSTELFNFFATPSTRITAGSNLSWSGNTLNATIATSSINYWRLVNGGLETATTTNFARAAYFVATSTTATSTFANAVGIGTTTPASMFVINSTANIDAQQRFDIGSGINYFRIGRSSSTGALSFQGTQTGFNNIDLVPTSGNLTLGNAATGDVNFLVGSGNAGFQMKLNHNAVNGADFTSVMGGADMLSFGFNTASAYGGTFGSSSGRTLYFYDRVASAYRGGLNASGTWVFGLNTSNFGLAVEQATAGASMIIKASGNVGINTTGPSTKLQVNGSASSYTTAPFSVTDSTTPTKGVRIWYDSATDNGQITAVQDSIAWKDLVLNGSGFGNVGIGVSPTARLDIQNGSARALMMANSTGRGDLLRFSGINGLNFSVNVWTPTASTELQTDLGINMQVDGTNGNVNYVTVGAKQAPTIRMNADDGSLSLFGENGSGGNFRTAVYNLGVKVMGNGNVGIASSSPSLGLVLGTGQMGLPDGSASLPSLTFNDDNDTGIYSSGNGAITFTVNASPRMVIGTQILSVSTGAQSAPAFSYNSDADTGMWFPSANNLALSAGNTDIVRITTVGLGIGTTTPGYKLSLDGTMGAKNLTTAAGTPNSICQNAATGEITVNAALTCTVSDEDQKSPLNPLEFSALEMIKKMQPSSFTYNDFPNRLRYGFGAQSLQKIDPRLADAYDKNGIARSIDLPAIIAVNTQAIKELTAIVERGVSGAKRSVEENYQWFIIGLLAIGYIRLNRKINKLNK